MEVLIVAKTKWGELFCISAIEVSTGKFIRLMSNIGGYQPSNIPYKVGQLWDLNYTCALCKPPHVEDVRVQNLGRQIGTIDNIREYILKNCLIWRGNTSTLFESKLCWEYNGSGYLNNSNNLPHNSVGFWISDKELTYDGSKYYNYKSIIPFNKRRFPYKGIEPAIESIPEGTLIRVSLAKWWSKDANTEERCYLQLSGWYI